jgi:Fe-S cluster assembly protein SufD
MSGQAAVSAAAEGLTEPLRDLSRESVERLSDALEDPGWLRERRLEAWEVYRRLPIPDTRGEAWRYTDLSRIPWQGAEVATTAGPEPEADELGPPDGLRGQASAAGAGYLEDGTARAGWLDPEAAAAGVVFTDLQSAIREHPALVEAHLLRGGITPELGKFAALHCALLGGGIFLYVPAGVEVALPLQSLRVMRREGAAVFPHTLIVAERESRVTYIEECLSGTGARLAMNCSAIEILARPGARVRIATLQEWGRHAFHYSLQRARLERQSTLNSLVVTLGGRLSRVEVQSVLAEEGSTSEMLGLYLGDRDQHLDHHTLQLHVAPHTNSDLLYKGALRGASRAAFSGLIKVAKGAQRTDAYQKNRNLLLSPEARADSLPNLEIEADDVRCSHGATIGPADELQLFYLMTRGLSRETAERLLVFGFFEEVLSRLPLPILRDQLRGAIERKSACGEAAGPRHLEATAAGTR